MTDIRHLGFQGSSRPVDYLKSPCTTSYRSSFETIALNCLIVFEKNTFLHFGESQTDKQPQRIKPLSLWRERLNNKAGIVYSAIQFSSSNKQCKQARLINTQAMIISRRCAPCCGSADFKKMSSSSSTSNSSQIATLRPVAQICCKKWGGGHEVEMSGPSGPPQKQGSGVRGFDPRKIV